MALKDTWKPKIDLVDEIMADDINAVADAVIELEEKTSSGGVTPDGTPIIIDDKMSPTSENPVQNKVVKAYIDEQDTSTRALVASAGQMAQQANQKADSAVTKAGNAQAKADSAYTLANAAGALANGAKTTAEDALYRLTDKQDRVEIVTDGTSTSIVFSALEFYNSDHRVKTSPDSIDFTFPTGEYPQDYITGLSFYSDDTPPTISYTVGNIINWVGTDCSIDTYTELNGEVYPVSIFQPSANTQYDIIIYFNGACFVGMVNGYKIASYNKNPSDDGIVEL